MITGATKSRVDGIWQKMWEGGVTNPLEVIKEYSPTEKILAELQKASLRIAEGLAELVTMLAGEEVPSAYDSSN